MGHIVAAQSGGCGLRLDTGMPECWANCPTCTSNPPPALRLTNLRGAANATGFCGIGDDHEAHCFGVDGYLQPPAPPGPLTLAVPADGVVCGLDPAGLVHCTSGHCTADPTGGPPSCAPYPEWFTLVGEGPGGAFVDLAGNASDFCGLRASGSVECWGMHAADFVAPAARYTQLAMGSSSACGLTDDGQIHCWGLGESPVPPPP